MTCSCRRLGALVAALFLFVGTAAFAQTAPAGTTADEVKVKKLLELSGAANVGKTICDQMMTQFKQSAVDVPASFWDEIAASDMNPASFVAMIVPIYQKHFTSDEVDQLIAFYESPIGRKLVGEQTSMMKDQMAAGQKWGQDIAMKVQQKLQARRSSTGK